MFRFFALKPGHFRQTFYMNVFVAFITLFLIGVIFFQAKWQFVNSKSLVVWLLGGFLLSTAMLSSCAFGAHASVRVQRAALVLNWIFILIVVSSTIATIWWAKGPSVWLQIYLGLPAIVNLSVLHGLFGPRNLTLNERLALASEESSPDVKKSVFRRISGAVILIVCWISVFSGILMFGIDGLPIRQGPTDNTFILNCLAAAYLGYKYAKKYRWLFSLIALLLMVATPSIFAFSKGKLGMDTSYNFADGTRYVGKVKDGKMHGFGSLTAAKGGYIGEFKNGKPDGHGTLKYANGDRYEGEFKGGQLNGKGVLSYANGDRYLGEFVDGSPLPQGTYFLSDGSKYVGLLNSYSDLRDNGKIDGEGTRTHINGDMYVGRWKDGQFDGRGTHTLGNGNKYVGEFKDNKYSGQGTLTLSNGDTYTGQFEEYKFNGDGSYSFATGAKYVGVFRNDQFDGRGTLVDQSGAKYIGDFKSNKPNGRGTLLLPDGRTQTGTWKDGAFLK